MRRILASLSLRSSLGKIRKSTFARNAGWLMAGQGASLLFQAINFVFLARLIGSTEYGVFVGAFAFTNLLAIYCSNGTGYVFLRHVSGRPSEYPAYFGNILMATSSLSVLMIVALTLLSTHFLNPASARLVFLLAIGNCLFAPLTMAVGQVFQAFEKMKTTATLGLIVTALRAIAVVVLILTMHHATAFEWAIVSTVVSGLAAVAALVLAVTRFGWPVFDVALARKHFLEGLNFAFAGSTSSVYNDIDKTMLSHYGLNQANGVYSMAYRVIDLSSVPIYAVRDAAYPKLFQLGRDGIAKSADYARRLLYRSLLIGVGISLILFLSAPIIPILAGAGFAQSVSALRWLAIIPVFRSIHQMKGVVLTSSGRQVVRTTSQLAIAIFNFGLNLWLIPLYGWLGAAWASIASDGALALIMWFAVRVLVRRSARGTEQISKL